MTTEASVNQPANSVSFDTLQNRNERRVVDTLNQYISDEGLELTSKDIQDAYALTLNKLPAHYAHRGTIVLRAKVEREDIEQAVRESVSQVLSQPKP